MAEVNKHRASIIQIAGFALMAPLGNMIVNVLGFDLFKFGFLFFLFYVLLILVLFYCGIICLLRSLEILTEGGSK